MKRKKNIIKIHGKDFEEHAPGVYYNYGFYKYSEKFKVNKYIIHIIYTTPVKVSNLKYVYDIQVIAIDKLKAEYPHITRKNSTSYTILELNQGARFVPDFNMFKQSGKYRQWFEKEKDINMGKMVLLHPVKHLKSYLTIKAALEIFVRGKGYVLTNKYEDSFKAIDKFSRIQKTKNLMLKY